MEGWGLNSFLKNFRVVFVSLWIFFRGLVRLNFSLNCFLELKMLILVLRDMVELRGVDVRWVLNDNEWIISIFLVVFMIVCLV